VTLPLYQGHPYEPPEPQSESHQASMHFFRTHIQKPWLAMFRASCDIEVDHMNRQAWAREDFCEDNDEEWVEFVLETIEGRQGVFDLLCKAEAFAPNRTFGPVWLDLARTMFPPDLVDCCV
jgi:hypothetical protein